jgi:hypothetical protein
MVCLGAYGQPKGLPRGCLGPPPGRRWRGFSNMKKPARADGRLSAIDHYVSNRYACRVHIPCLRGGVVSSCLMSGFTCSRWQREPSGPQTELTLSQERQLPSGPRSPGPPRVPQVALAIDGRAMTRAAVRVGILVISPLGHLEK